MQDAYFEQWLQFALRRRVIIAEVAAAIIVVVIAATFLWPPVYSSSAEILVQDNRAQLLVSPALENNTPNQPAVVSNAVTEEDLNSERELLSSDYLIRQALDGLAAPKDGAAHALVSAAEWVLNFPTWLYAVLHGETAGDTNRAMGASRGASFIFVGDQALQRYRNKFQLPRSEMVSDFFAAVDRQVPGNPQQHVA